MYIADREKNCPSELSYRRIGVILAKENIKITYNKNANEAWFNPQNRELSMPTPILGLPVDVYNLYISHEVSHALHTPHSEGRRDIEYIMGKEDFAKATNQEKNFAHTLMNIVEDARIERLIIEKYRGLYRMYRNAYMWLLKNTEDVIGWMVDREFLTSEKCTFADQLNAFFKIGRFVDPVADHLRKSWSPEKNKIIDDTLIAQTFKDVLNICKRLWEEFKREMENMKSSTDVEYVIGDEDEDEIEDCGGDGDVAGKSNAKGGADENDGEKKDEGESNGEESDEDGDDPTHGQASNGASSASPEQLACRETDVLDHLRQDKEKEKLSLYGRKKISQFTIDTKREHDIIDRGIFVSVQEVMKEFH